MIKFFRNTRKSLISDGKISKYLLYAIGEIVLVVVGILIALAINNYNQDKDLKLKEQTYLIGLKSEFETSKLKLKELIEVNKGNYDGAKQIIEHISKKNEPPTESQFSILLLNTFSSDISFNPNNSLLNEMINSGSLKDISNTELRIALTNWISALDNISEQENELRIQREKVLDIFRIGNGNLRTILDNTTTFAELEIPKMENNTSNLNLLESTEFENNILLFILTSYVIEKSHYNPLMQNVNYILELIDKEIK